MNANEINVAQWADWFKMTTHNDPEIEAMISKCAAFGLDFKSKASPRWLTILGSTGTGKTHCANRLWEYTRNRSDFSKCKYQPEKIYWPKFISELKGGSSYDKMRDMWNWPVLYIDDILTGSDKSDFTSEQLNTLMGCREGKWTIITSNLMLDQIGETDTRMADRIIRGTNRFIEVKTESHSIRTFGEPIRVHNDL